MKKPLVKIVHMEVKKKESVDYCLTDYKNHHSWTRVGIDRGMIIYQCIQCRKCAFEKIEMIGNLFPREKHDQ